MDSFAGDDRAVSEASGVAILIGITVLVTASVGLNVLLVGEQDTGPPDANFTYDHVEDNGALLITHSQGDEFPAGELLIEGPREEVTWAAAAGKNESAPIGPGDIAQISRGNAYGETVRSTDTVRIYHATNDSQRQLSQWPEQFGS